MADSAEVAALRALWLEACNAKRLVDHKVIVAQLEQNQCAVLCRDLEQELRKKNGGTTDPPG